MFPFSPRVRFFLFAVGLTNVILVGRDLLVAYFWGTSQPLDEFQSSMIVPVMVMTVLSFVLAGAFLPAYMKMKRQRPEELANFCNRLLSSAQVAFLAIFAAGWLINEGPHALPLSIYGLLFSLTNLPRMILIAEGRDREVLVAPIVSLIVGLTFLVSAYKPFGIHALSGAYILFVFVEYLFLIAAVRSRGLMLSPFSLAFHKNEFETLKGEMGFLTAASLFMAVTITIEQKIAQSFGPGALPHYTYATKICTMLAAVGGSGIKNYLFPNISAAVAGGDFRLARWRTRHYVLKYLLWITPLCLALSFVSPHLTRLLFERGAFRPEDTLIVGHIQSFLFLQIPSYFATFISLQALMAARRARLVMMATLVNALFRAGGSLWLSGYFGLAGIAIGVSFAQLVAGVVTFILADRTFKSLSQDSSSTNFSKAG